VKAFRYVESGTLCLLVTADRAAGVTERANGPLRHLGRSDKVSHRARDTISHEHLDHFGDFAEPSTNPPCGHPDFIQIPWELPTGSLGPRAGEPYEWSPSPWVAVLAEKNGESSVDRV
jgi:hypothetical protein